MPVLGLPPQNSDSPLIEHLERAFVQPACAQAGEVVAFAPLNDRDIDPRQRQFAGHNQPVGPPPAITTACFAMATLLSDSSCMSLLLLSLLACGRRPVGHDRKLVAIPRL